MIDRRLLWRLDVWAGIIVLVTIGLSASVLLFSYGFAGGHQVASPRPSVGNTPSSPATSQAPATPLTPALAIGRSGLAPNISPDGKWIVSVTEVGSPDLGVEHALILSATTGNTKTTLATVDDALDPSVQAPVVHDWEPAGWSADGSTVYFAERIETAGGSSGIVGGIYGQTLYSISAKGGKATKIGTFGSGIDPATNGIVAVAPVHKRVAYLDEGKLYVAGFDGSDKAGIFTPPAGSNIWQALFDPSTKRVALLLITLQHNGQYAWDAGIADANGFTNVGPSLNGGLLDWTSTNGLTYLEVQSGGQSFSTKTADGSTE